MRILTVAVVVNVSVLIASFLVVEASFAGEESINTQAVKSESSEREPEIPDKARVQEGRIQECYQKKIGVDRRITLYGIRKQVEYINQGVRHTPTWTLYYLIKENTRTGTSCRVWGAYHPHDFMLQPDVKPRQFTVGTRNNNIIALAYIQGKPRKIQLFFHEIDLAKVVEPQLPPNQPKRQEAAYVLPEAFMPVTKSKHSFFPVTRLEERHDRRFQNITEKDLRLVKVRWDKTHWRIEISIGHKYFVFTRRKHDGRWMYLLQEAK